MDSPAVGHTFPQPMNGGGNKVYLPIKIVHGKLRGTGKPKEHLLGARTLWLEENARVSSWY